MPIECYALVEQPKPLTEDESVWNKHWRKQGITRTILKSPTTITLCHLKLIQPIQKGKKPPEPKWQIVKELLSENEYRKEDGWSTSVYDLDGNPIRIGYLFTLDIYDNSVPFMIKKFGLCDYDIDQDLVVQWTHSLVTIDDMRITLAQIRHLFPECAKMPKAIALDYVRDKL